MPISSIDLNSKFASSLQSHCDFKHASAVVQFSNLGCDFSSPYNRDLKNNEISWTIEDMNGAFSGLDKLRWL